MKDLGHHLMHTLYMLNKHRSLLGSAICCVQINYEPSCLPGLRGLDYRPSRTPMYVISRLIVSCARGFRGGGLDEFRQFRGCERRLLSYESSELPHCHIQERFGQLGTASSVITITTDLNEMAEDAVLSSQTAVSWVQLVTGYFFPL